MLYYKNRADVASALKLDRDAQERVKRAYQINTLELNACHLKGIE